MAAALCCCQDGWIHILGRPSSMSETHFLAQPETGLKKIVFDTITLNLLNSVACKHIWFHIMRHEFRRRMV